MSEKKTHWRKLRDQKWIGSWDFVDGEEKVVTIKSATSEDIKSERGTEACTVLKFAEKGTKPMVMNVTNSERIEEMYGSPYVEDWVGKKITLHVEQVKVKGEWIDAVRVKPGKPVLPEMTPQHENWAAVKKAVLTGTYTVDQIRSKYTISEENQKKLELDPNRK